MSDVRFESIRDFGKITDDLVHAGNLAFCVNVVGQAKDIAPLDQGQLRNSIQYVVYGGEKGGMNDSPGENADKGIDIALKNKEAAFGATAGHAIYQEYGTRYTKPAPYMRPAIEIAKGTKISTVLKAIKKAVEMGVTRAGKRNERLG